MSEEFETLQNSPAVLYGACGGIWVMIIRARPNAPEMYLARPSLKAMHRQYPAGFPTLTWVLPEAGFSMERDAREAATEVTKEFESAILAQATLIEGSGFHAAAVRAIIVGLDTVLRSPAPKKTFSELSVAVTWCLGLRPAGARALPRPTPADVVTTLAQVRAAPHS